MIKQLSFYFPLIILSLSLCIACGDPSNRTKAFSPKKLHLEKAVLSAEMALGSIGDVGYVQWTPITAAQELVNSLNSSQVLLPEEKEQYKEAKIKPVTIPFTLNQPTEKWQVVIIPEEDKSIIRVEGYGDNLEKPLLIKKLPCCQ